MARFISSNYPLMFVDFDPVDFTFLMGLFLLNFVLGFPLCVISSLFPSFLLRSTPFHLFSSVFGFLFFTVCFPVLFWFNKHLRCP